MKPLTTGGPQMCHGSSSWSEIQYPHQNLIYDQPVERGEQGGQSTAFLRTTRRGKSEMLKGLRKVVCWKSSAKALAQRCGRSQRVEIQQLNPNHIQFWTKGSAACEASKRNQSDTALGAGRAHCKWWSISCRTCRTWREKHGRPGERKAFCPRSCCDWQQSQEQIKGSCSTIMSCWVFSDSSLCSPYHP